MIISLEPEEKVQLFQRLPSLELSYEPKIHKKVCADLYYIIPKGIKALLYYTYWKEDDVCFMITLNEQGHYNDIKMVPTVLTFELALGTIIYGTAFHYQRRQFFSCEKLHYYQGVDVQKKTIVERFALFADMFGKHMFGKHMFGKHMFGKHIDAADGLKVGLPVLTTTYENALEQMNRLPYKVYGVGVYKNSQTHAQQQVQQVPKVQQAHAPTRQAPTRQAQRVQQAPARQVQQVPTRQVPTRQVPKVQIHIFQVKAEPTADTYQLYENNKPIGTAMIPTYKCSVMMNTLFRNIKENANLDLLEESDEEDEFENTQINKFVDLDKTLSMECVFLKKFQKWQPIKYIA
jgi:hypothetical protein